MIGSVAENYGDFASVAGLVLSFVGFGATIYSVQKSRSASQAAKEAALGMQEAIAKQDVTGEFTRIISILEEIKRLHRAEAWYVVMDRYVAAKHCLNNIKNSGIGFEVSERATIQGCIQGLSDMEKTMERAITSKNRYPAADKFNDVISQHIESLQQITSLQRGNLR